MVATAERKTVTEEEIAAWMGVSQKTVARNRDKLPKPIRIGRQRFYPRSEVMALFRVV